jgi:hypothetical protein
MTATETAREMRANGKRVPDIASKCNISVGHVYRITSDVKRRFAQTTDTITRMLPRNGGCSSLSGLVPITMPRIAALHGAA